MKWFFAFFIFCLILFLYLHILFHVKTSDDLEVYEIEDVSKDKWEEICDVRQPVILSYEPAKNILPFTSRNYLLEHYPHFEINIREKEKEKNTLEQNSEWGVPLPLYQAISLFQNDTTSTYFSEKNNEFLKDTSVTKIFKNNDAFLRPPMVSNCYYDILFGSKNSSTPLRYELNYRNYFMVVEGKITIKLTPPKSSKYLHAKKDYEHFEFLSLMDPWNIQPNYKTEFSKIKMLELVLYPGQLIYVPAYWWYSIQFHDKSSVAAFRYRTYMNNIAIAPQLLMYTLQINNVKRNRFKKADTNTEKIIGSSDNEDMIDKNQEKNEGEVTEQQDTDTANVEENIQQDILSSNEVDNSPNINEIN